MRGMISRRGLGRGKLPSDPRLELVGWCFLVMKHCDRRRDGMKRTHTLIMRVCMLICVDALAYAALWAAECRF